MGFLQNGSRESRGGGALVMPTSLPSWGSSWGDVSPENLSRPAAPCSRAFVNNRSNCTEAAWNVLCLSVLPRNRCATTGIHSRSPAEQHGDWNLNGPIFELSEAWVWGKEKRNEISGKSETLFQDNGFFRVSDLLFNCAQLLFGKRDARQDERAGGEGRGGAGTKGSAAVFAHFTC